ncbi:MAG: T9SS type A sorting domain-containing protein [Bacteroidetes bacterium]|nr:T9SS type A sorting domain-containing protein [Bacteroidota bacterium]
MKKILNRIIRINKGSTFMKATLLCIMLFLFFVSTYPQTDCPGGISDKRGNIKWYFDESSLTGVRFTEQYPASYLNNSQIIPIVRSAITNALYTWANATDGVVQVSEGDAANYNLKIDFVDMGWGGGEGDQYYGYAPPGNYEIQINKNVNVTWTDIESLVTPNYHYPDIITVILHEAGHIFNLTHRDLSTSVMNYSNLSVKRSLTSCDHSTVENLYNPQHTITVQNSFGGGTVKVTDKNGTSSYPSSPDTFYPRENTWPWTISAIDQIYPDPVTHVQYMRRFQNWTDKNNTPSYSRDTTIPKSDNTYTANFLKEYNIIFQNNFPCLGNGGVINVNGTQYNFPTSPFTVLDSSSITAAAIDQTINGIYYSFDHWSQEGGTNQTYIFYPTDHTTYTAYFIGYPSNYGKYLHNDLNYGQPITLRWTDNPNPSVTYQIWRIVKHNGVLGNPVQIGTVGRGIQSYTDDLYILDLNYTHDLLWYDVREYYSCDNTYSTPDWLAIYGEIAPKIALTLNNNINTSEIKDYSLTCFPNPFNPSTKINFTLPEDQQTRLVIYDVLGRVVKELINNYVPRGSYIIVWDGTNNSGVKVNSGIYFYSMQTYNKKIIEKMILAK